jgi:hypothetical protein
MLTGTGCAGKEHDREEPQLQPGAGTKVLSLWWSGGVSTAKGGYFRARIDTASAQVSPLERRGEALDLLADQAVPRPLARFLASLQLAARGLP